MMRDTRDRQPAFNRLIQYLWLVVTAACVVGLTGINIYRAATQSITHDEAVTYERYVSGPLYRLVSSSDANNHVLNSILCRCSVGVIGTSELALRLPSVAAGFLFLAIIARIGWRVWGPSVFTPAAVLLLGLNPFVLDYLSAARGYSLALMFWVAALERLLAASQDSSSWAGAGGRNQSLRRASQFLALAVLGNLTFAPAAVALAAFWGAWAWGERRQVAELPAQTIAWFWTNLGRPGAVVMACLALPLAKLQPSNFYFGATSAPDSLRSLVLASFVHHPQRWPIDNGAAWYQGLINCLAWGVLPALVLALVALWVVVAFDLFRQRSAVGPRQPEPGVMLFYLSAGTLGLTLLLLTGLHAFGMKLPLERTGLYLLPPFGLAFLSAGKALASTRTWPILAARLAPWITRAAVVVALLICLAWGAQLQTTHYRPWLCESDSRTVFHAIAAFHDPSSKQRLRIGATWCLAPALNFYRDKYKAEFVERIQRRSDYPPETDLYVIATASGGTPAPEPAVVLYHNPTTGTTVAAPARRGPLVSAGRDR